MALLDNLVSHWKLDEASGTRADSFASNDLTDNNTVGSATGLINNAADFEAGNSEYLSHADNTDLRTGDVDFTFAGWVKLESKVTQVLACKTWDGNADEWILSYESSQDRFRFATRYASNTYDLVFADNFGSPSTGVWYFIVVWHDAAANEICITIDDVAPDVQATTSAPAGSATAVFAIGIYSPGNANLVPADALIDECAFWKRVITGAEITQLYDAGAGLPFDQWDDDPGDDIEVHYWAFFQLRASAESFEAPS